MHPFWPAALMAAGAASAQAPIKHRFLAVDNGGNRLVLVDQTGGKGWTVAIPAGSRDLQWLPGGKVLVSHGNGPAEYALADGSKGWSVEGYSAITTARRLANGNTLLGLAASHKIVETDAKGAIVWTGAPTDKGYVAYRLANGHTVAASGEDCLVYDFACDGKATVLAGGLAKHPGKGLLWFSGFEILADGHFLIANWNGHGKEGQGPHALEFDAANNLAWSWADHAGAATVSNVMTVEGSGPVAIRDAAPRETRRLPPRIPRDAMGRAREGRYGA